MSKSYPTYFPASAESAVMGISSTAANYRPTLDSLRELFGDPSLLIGLYTDKLVHVERAKDNDVASFRHLVDTFESSLREIRQLIEEVSLENFPSKSASFLVPVHDLLLGPIFVSKLPGPTR